MDSTSYTTAAYAWNDVSTHLVELWTAASTLSLPAARSAAQSPVAVAVACTVLFAVYAFVMGIVRDEYSVVDRQWSVAPVVYAVLVAVRVDGRPGDARVLIMAALVLLWGSRLTWNFARKGGYNSSHAEDYRWPVLRKMINNAVLWQLFNLTFIAAYQHFLIAAFTSPVFLAWYARDVPLGVVDGAAIVLCVLFLVGETVADQQQWEFQQSKHGAAPRLDHHADDYRRGFLTSGLFAVSRHPNFFCEQAFWCSLSLFSVAAAGGLNWSVAGCVLLVALFQGSTPFTESISAAKYPAYAVYQKHVPALFPVLSAPPAIPWPKDA